MSPDTIKVIMERRFGDAVVVKPRHNPDGWAFYDRVTSERLFRAIRSTPASETKLKRAATSRLTGKPHIEDFQGDEAALMAMVVGEYQSVL